MQRGELRRVSMTKRWAPVAILMRSQQRKSTEALKIIGEELQPSTSQEND
jgi:hypothetical protein